MKKEERNIFIMLVYIKLNVINEIDIYVYV